MGLPWCQHFSWRPGGFHFFNPKMHMLFFIRVSYRIVKYENLKHQFWHWYWTHWNVGSEQDCPKVILKDMRLQDSLRYCFPRPDMIHKNACLVHIYIYLFIYLKLVARDYTIPQTILSKSSKYHEVSQVFPQPHTMNWWQLQTLGYIVCVLGFVYFCDLWKR